MLIFQKSPSVSLACKYLLSVSLILLFALQSRAFPAPADYPRWMPGPAADTNVVSRPFVPVDAYALDLITPDILYMCDCRDVVHMWPYTSSILAGVMEFLSAGYFSFDQNVSDFVSTSALYSGMVSYSIPVWIGDASPDPALVSFLYLSPESLTTDRFVVAVSSTVIFSVIGSGKCPGASRTGLSIDSHEKKIRVVHCNAADQEHEESRRQYAHTYHKPGVICVASSFFRLPETNRLALLLHEVGHILRGSGPHSEDAANEAAYRASGVRVYYRDGKAGPEVEWIRPQDKRKAREFLGL